MQSLHVAYPVDAEFENNGVVQCCTMSMPARMPARLIGSSIGGGPAACELAAEIEDKIAIVMSCKLAFIAILKDSISEKTGWLWALLPPEASDLRFVWSLSHVPDLRTLKDVVLEHRFRFARPAEETPILRRTADP